MELVLGNVSHPQTPRAAVTATPQCTRAPSAGECTDVGVARGGGVACATPCAVGCGDPRAAESVPANTCRTPTPTEHTVSATARCMSYVRGVKDSSGVHRHASDAHQQGNRRMNATQPRMSLGINMVRDFSNTVDVIVDIFLHCSYMLVNVRLCDIEASPLTRRHHHTYLRQGLILFGFFHGINKVTL